MPIVSGAAIESTMSNYKFSDDDEFTHTPDASPNFNESVYVNGFEPQRRFGGWMRIGNRINEGHAEAHEEHRAENRRGRGGRVGLVRPE